MSDSTQAPPKWIGSLLPTLQASLGDIPLWFALGWIAVESGGRLEDTTSMDERGYFQIDPRESAQLGLDHARLSIDPVYSIQAGAQLIRYYSGRADAVVPGTDEIHWRWTKLFHTIGSGATSSIASAMQSAGADVTDWDAVRDEGLNQGRDEKWFDLIDRLVSRGKLYSVLAGAVTNPQVAIPVGLVLAGMALLLFWPKRRSRT